MAEIPLPGGLAPSRYGTSTASPTQGQGAFGKGAPAPMDYPGIAEKQNQANRPGQTTPFGSSQWTQDANGNWQQNVQFGGPLAGAFGNVSQQAADAMGKPLDFGGLAPIQHGEEARKAAIDARYGQATSRLDPMWNQREEAERTRLINQGLDPSSEAYGNFMDDFNRQRNDAYGSAMNSAITAGAEDADRMFNQSAQVNQIGQNQMMLGRNQPLTEMKWLQGLLNMPQFNPATGMVEAAQGRDLYNLKSKELENKQWTDLFGGLTSLLGEIIPG